MKDSDLKNYLKGEIEGKLTKILEERFSLSKHS